MLGSLGAIPAATLLAQSAGDVIVTRGVKISMRTGAPLTARVYRLGGAPRPTILSLETDTTAARDASAGPRVTTVGFLGEGARDDEPADTLKTGSKTYETPLRAPIDLAGFPSVTLWIESAAAAAASVSIEEVRSDGTVVPLVPLVRSAGFAPRPDSGAVVRGPLRWEFSEFGWIATRVAAGSRLRFTIQGPQGVVVFHDTERYSLVILPVVKVAR